MSTTDMDLSDNAIDELVGQVERNALLAAQERQSAARRDQERQERARTAKAEADRRANERAAQAPAPPADGEPESNHTGLSPAVAGMGFAFQPPPENEQKAALHQADRRTGALFTKPIHCSLPHIP